MEVVKQVKLISGVKIMVTLWEIVTGKGTWQAFGVLLMFYFLIWALVT